MALWWQLGCFFALKGRGPLKSIHFLQTRALQWTRLASLPPRASNETESIQKPTHFCSVDEDLNTSSSGMQTRSGISEESCLGEWFVISSFGHWYLLRERLLHLCSARRIRASALSMVLFHEHVSLVHVASRRDSFGAATTAVAACESYFPRWVWRVFCTSDCRRLLREIIVRYITIKALAMFQSRLRYDRNNQTTCSGL